MKSNPALLNAIMISQNVMIIKKCSSCGREVIFNDYLYCPYCGSEIILEVKDSNEASFVIDKDGVLTHVNFLDGATIKLPENVKAIGPFAFRQIGEHEDVDKWRTNKKRIDHLIINKSLEKISPVAFIPVSIGCIDVGSLDHLMKIKGEIITEADKTREYNVWDCMRSYELNNDDYNDDLLTFFCSENLLINGKLLVELTITKSIVDSFNHKFSPCIYSNSINAVTVDKDVSFFPNGLIYFGKNLVTFRINSSHLSFEKGAFYWSKIKRIDLSNCELNKNLFWYSEDLCSVKLSAQCKCIPQYCFSNCHALQSINLSNINIFGECSFSGCKKLHISSKDIASAKFIESRAFEDCLINDTLVLPPTLEKLGGYGGGAFTKAFKELTISSNLEIEYINSETVIICEGVKEVVFYGSNVKNIHLPSTIKKIIFPNHISNIFTDKDFINRCIEKNFALPEGSTLYYGEKRVDEIHIRTRSYNINILNVRVENLYLDEGVEEIKIERNIPILFYPKVLHIPSTLKTINFLGPYHRGQIKLWYVLDKIVFNGTKKEWNNRSGLYKNLPSAKTICCIDGNIDINIID